MLRALTLKYITFSELSGGKDIQ